ncbi:MAG: replication protein RepA [Acidobacteriota bacterium]|nr:replication protein RepA [Acidobacteriota bacterium]
MLRLALAWLSTEAVRRRSREIELGPTFSSFMYKLGLTPVTGKRGTTSRLGNQLHRLFSTTIRCSYKKPVTGLGGRMGETSCHRFPTPPASATPSPSSTSSGGHREIRTSNRYGSVVVLSSEFYDELVAHAVPIDLRALRALKGSPLALDIYSWLTYRMRYLRKPCLVLWEALQTQFGADYGRPRNFRRKFLIYLADVLHLYPAVRLSVVDRGLLMRPSPSYISKGSKDTVQWRP